MRVFFAIDLPEEIKQKIDKFNSNVIYSVFQKMKKVSIENLHITLKFIGEVEKPVVDSLLSELEAQKSTKIKSANVQISGIGVFPNVNRARILWIGARCPDLMAIYNHIQSVLKKLNIPTEDEKEFHPHITVGRFKDSPQPRTLQTILERHKNERFGQFEINSFTLYESTLTPQKPIYTPLHQFRI